MKITKTKNYTLIKPNDNSLNIFIESLKNRYSEFEGFHLILDFSEIINIKLKDLLLFLKLGKKHKKNGTSFVLVVKGIDIDEIPEEISVAPTIIEAIDILEMDAIERDLGF